MTIWEAIFQGILQGLAEFLPISSSGHLSVYQHLAGIENGLSMTVFLHLGTLLAVFAVFYKKLWGLICELGLTIADIFRGKFSLKEMTPRRRMLLMMILSCIPLLAVLLIKDRVSALSTDNDIVVEGLCFLFTGALILLSSHFAAQPGLGRTAADMKPLDALLIGAAQLVATLPGVSRSGSTISASLLLGYERDYAFDYSFLLGTPAILAATAIELKDAAEGGVPFEALPVLIGIAVAAVVGYFAIRLMGRLVRSGRFRYFGYYCLLIGVLTLAAGIYEHASGQNVMTLFGR